MKAPLLASLAAIAAFVSTAAAAGVATSGGMPDIEVVMCGDAVMGSSGMGGLSLSVRDPRVTTQPLQVRVTAAFDGAGVHFNGGAGGDKIELALQTEPAADGIFHGDVSVGTRSAPVECTFLADAYRPLPDQTLALQYRVGGSRCWSNGQCGGFIGGLIPHEFSVTLRFDAGALKGEWSVEEEAFGETVVIKTEIVKARGAPATFKVSTLRQGATTPATITVAQDILPEIKLESPIATADAAETASFWVEMSSRH